MTSVTALEAPVGGEFALFGGAVVSVRPVCRQDADLLADLHDQLSGRCTFLRYFGRQTCLSSAELEHLSTGDGSDRLALVVERAGRLLAVGQYQRLEDHSDADVTLLMIDELEHHGIALILLRQLAQAAAKVGITHFVTEVAMGDRRMMALFHDPGSAVAPVSNRGTVVLRMTIE